MLSLFLINICWFKLIYPSTSRGNFHSDAVSIKICIVCVCFFLFFFKYLNRCILGFILMYLYVSILTQCYFWDTQVLFKGHRKSVTLTCINHVHFLWALIVQLFWRKRTKNMTYYIWTIQTSEPKNY